MLKLRQVASRMKKMAWFVRVYREYGHYSNIVKGTRISYYELYLDVYIAVVTAQNELGRFFCFTRLREASQAVGVKFWDCFRI